MSWSVRISLKKHFTPKVVILSKQTLSRRWQCPISVSVLVRLVSDSNTVRKDCRVHRGTVMSGPLVFRLPVLSRASYSWLERTATNSSTCFTWSSNVRGSSSLAFLSSPNKFAYWAILLCRGVSPFADVNILTGLLPVSHTKTVFRYAHKADSIFHRLLTPSQSVTCSFSTHLCLGFGTLKHLFFFHTEQCVLFAGGQKHSSIICYCNTHEAWNIWNCSQFQSSSQLTKMNTWTTSVSNLQVLLVTR